MQFSDVTCMEIELSTRCNAKCPQCARNFHGSRSKTKIPIVDLNLSVIKKIPFDKFANLESIRICGTYGDPIFNKDLFSIIEHIKTKTSATIVVHTNGAVHSKSWWSKLALVMDNADRVYFGIDGLEDTNGLHRIGVKYSKVIENLIAFNEAGGKSVWTFLIFKHNQHQLDAVKKLSEELGCYGFVVKTTSRFLTREHKVLLKFPVLNEDRDVMYYLEPATIKKYINSNYQKVEKNLEKQKNKKLSCKYQLYIAADGFVFPCPWLGDRMYGEVVEDTDDQKRLLALIEKLGRKNINLNYTNIENIIFGDWFQHIEQTFTKNHFARCIVQCGILWDLNSKASFKLPKFGKE
jgi:MoaA/NifB/PqqE/SkfB family radical SAM enzyme